VENPRRVGRDLAQPALIPEDLRQALGLGEVFENSAERPARQQRVPEVDP
jgi:hypothetical protein